jgi:two-component system, OmpR family, alkaline phosphatase synthesis response regulator PhoP
MSSLGRILIVEDDMSIQEFMSMALEDEGYKVAIASNGAVALDLASSFKPDLILLDMLMPVMDGREFIESYFGIANSPARIIALSASRNLNSVVNITGVDAFLAKPFNLDELLDCVRQHTAGVVSG